jgi:hypothetical protein
LPLQRFFNYIAKSLISFISVPAIWRISQFGVELGWAAPPAGNRVTLIAQRSALMTQRRPRFALIPLAMATAAIDMPGWLQAVMTYVLNSSVLKISKNGTSTVGIAGRAAISEP